MQRDAHRRAAPDRGRTLLGPALSLIQTGQTPTRSALTRALDVTRATAGADVKRGPGTQVQSPQVPKDDRDFTYRKPSLPRTKTLSPPPSCTATGTDDTTPPRSTQGPQAPPAVSSVRA